MFKFKIDVMKELHDRGITTYKIRTDNLFGQKTLADIKKGIVPGIKSLDILCEKLDMPIGDIIEYVKTENKTKDGGISAEN